MIRSGQKVKTGTAWLPVLLSRSGTQEPGASSVDAVSFVIPRISYPELPEVMVQMFGLELACKLAGDFAENWMEWPLFRQSLPGEGSSPVPDIACAPSQNHIAALLRELARCARLW
jgi:hypothetical protein